MADFLKDLPSHNRANFQNLDGATSQKDGFSQGRRTCGSVKRPAVFIQTKDYPSEQILITTEKTNILLRYLQQHLDKKNNKKREASNDPMTGVGRKQAKVTKDG